jgi:threonine dehydrogenase-like Zn-dependent dehydrogenase
VHLVETNPETGYIRCSAPADIPLEGRIIGHEGVGQVIAIGSNVQHIKEGDYATFESIIVCHYCDMCRKGRFNQCRHAKLLGLEKDGLFGTIVDIPAMLAHDVSTMTKTKKGIKAAACIEPAGVAYVACQNTHVIAGDVVAIFGAGPIGIFSAMLCKNILGASVVYMVEPIEFRRKLAQKWSDYVYDNEGFFNKCNHPVDVVIEASGHTDNINRIFPRLNAGGRIALLARSGESLVINAIDHMITNAISIVGSRGHLGGAFDRIISLYNNGQLPLEEIVTEEVQGPQGIQELLSSPQRIIKQNCKVLGSFEGVRI